MESVYTRVPEDKPPEIKNSDIPQALRETPRWMGTRFKKRKDGKVDKPPYCVVPGKPITKADKTNPENWTTYP
jgi:primase-polymerase (primpol)-like protein